MEEKKTNFSKEIKQSRELPRFRYKLGINEQKLLLCLIGQLKQSAETFEKSEIPVEDVTKYCGFDDANNRRLIRQTTMELAKSGLEYYNNDENFGFVSWFSYIIRKNGKIFYQFNNAIKSELLQLYDNNKIYISIDPLLLPKFRSTFGLRFYLILKGVLASHRNEISYSVEELCSLLMLSSAYNPKDTINASGNQRVKVIEPSVKEINSVSNITVSYEAIKESRKIIGWKFNIKQKEPVASLPAPSSQAPMPQPDETPWYMDERVEDAAKELVKHGLDRATLPKFFKKFDSVEDFIKAQVVALDTLTSYRTKNIDVDSPGGVLYKAMDEYDPALTNLFNDMDNEVQEESTKKLEKETAISAAIQNAITWEDIVSIVMQQSDKAKIVKMLNDAAAQHPELLERYKTAYSMKYPDTYDLDVEIARLHVDGINAIKPPSVDYSLLDNK